MEAFASFGNIHYWCLCRSCRRDLGILTLRSRIWRAHNSWFEKEKKEALKDSTAADKELVANEKMMPWMRPQLLIKRPWKNPLQLAKGHCKWERRKREALKGSTAADKRLVAKQQKTPWKSPQQLRRGSLQLKRRDFEKSTAGDKESVADDEKEPSMSPQQLIKSSLRLNWGDLERVHSSWWRSRCIWRTGALKESTLACCKWSEETLSLLLVKERSLDRIHSS